MLSAIPTSRASRVCSRSEGRAVRAVSIIFSNHSRLVAALPQLKLETSLSIALPNGASLSTVLCLKGSFVFGASSWCCNQSKIFCRS